MHTPPDSTHSAISLRRFLAIAIILVSSITFVIVLSITSLIYQSQIKKDYTALSHSLAGQVFTSILSGMQGGWTRADILNEIKRFSGLFPNRFAIKVHRNPALTWENHYQDEHPDENITAIFGGKFLTKDRPGTTLYYRFVAETGCISCHPSAKPGDVLGVMAITEDLMGLQREAWRKFLLVFTLISPFPLLMTFLVVRRVNRRIGDAVDILNQKVHGVTNVEDLTTLQLEGQRLGFRELDAIFGEFGRIVAQIRKVAVGKEMLEFEIQILEKFIITSESIRDWKERVTYLLTEVNKVMPAFALFCMFQIDDEAYDIEVFWHHRPTDPTRDTMEEIIQSRISDEKMKLGQLSSVKVIHNVIEPDGPPLHLDRREIELQTKSLFLDLPQIGGVVGIGVQSQSAVDPIRSLVVDSILTTLLNVVGSIKAIYKFTKDLEYYATRDPLTNLYNQRVFWELFGYEVGRAERHNYQFGLLVIDMDNFKYINDGYGHIFGDKFLTAVADTIHNSLRKGDILSRYGGDEFTVLLPEADEKQVYLVACRIREALQEMMVATPDGTTVHATASIGMAIYPTHARNEKDLFLFADNMTYKAKHSGKNCIIVPTESDVVDVFKHSGEISKLLIQALDEKRVIPYFQPIVAQHPDLPVCHEVLCRIQVGDRVISAAEFIETAEKLSIVSKLDCILMEKVFHKIMEENYQGLIFINLSPRSLILQDFIPSIISLARQYRIRHDRVVFELTERDTVKNMTLLEQFVGALKLEGFKFAIDDFGSGFSSFMYIRRLPIDFVKIEGLFVRNMLKDYKDLAFVKTLAVLAKEFGIKSVAEYVENEELLGAIREVGIDYAQGYHTGRPEPNFQAGSATDQGAPRGD